MAEGTPDIDHLVDSYYKLHPFTAIMHVRIDTKEVATVAKALAERPEVVDLFLVMGDTDFIAKIRCENPAAMKQVLVTIATEVSGIKDMNTMNVVTVYKEEGQSEQ